jgi:AP-3 complex subunit delta-1
LSIGVRKFLGLLLCFLQRIGYLAAAQSFHDGTDVLMLTTNMIRKDLGSNSMYDAGVALGGLACFLTADLARDLANDIMTLVCFIVLFCI